MTEIIKSVSYNVIVTEPSYNVTVTEPTSYNVSTRSGIIMARRLSDLEDVDLSNVKDKFVLMYDETENKYKAYNPDEVLSASAVTETTQPGLPQDFIDYLNENLDVDRADFAELLDKINNLTLGDLKNVDDSDKKDKYLIMFSALYNEYKAVNPDEVFKAAVSEELGGEPEQPGLPDEFLDQLDEDLDNRIDIDAGSY